jgi:transposase
MLISPDTLLRRIRQSPLSNYPTSRVLGVDDWAFQKGYRYGTLLVDLELRRPVNLLPNRKSSTLTDCAIPGFLTTSLKAL